LQRFRSTRRATSIAGFIATALLLFGATAAHAQTAIVRGTVITMETGLPIAAAQVALRDSLGDVRHQTRTDSVGAFRLDVAEAGRYTLTAEAETLAPAAARDLEIGAGADIVLEIQLGSGVMELDAIEVVVRQPRETQRVLDFHERAAFNRSIGRGRIFTRADVERLHPRSAESLLGTIPTGRCTPHIRIDGSPAYRADLRSITPANLEGMEVYMGVEIPREFQEPGVCGVALVWTRSQPEGMRPMGIRRFLLGGIVAAAAFLFMR
jgi:hypothetical protein